MSIKTYPLFLLSCVMFIFSLLSCVMFISFLHDQKRNRTKEKSHRLAQKS